MSDETDVTRTHLFVAATLALASEFVLPRKGWGIPIAALGVVGTYLIIDSVRRHRPALRLGWYFLAGSLLTAALGSAVQYALDRPALDLPLGSHVMIVASLIFSIIGYGLFVRARTRVLDRYQLLDLAIFLVSACVALSQLVLEPAMDASPPAGLSRGLSTAYILMMLVSVVLEARFVTLPGKRVPAMWWLASAMVTCLVGSMLANATSSQDWGGIRMSWILLAAVLMTVMAASHPSMRDLTEPATGEAPSFGVLRLVGLAAALFLTPLTAVLVYARTDSLNPVAVVAPAAVVTVLVMARLRLLFAREQTAREEVAASREAFSALVHGISDVITVVDASGAVAYATNSASRTLARQPDELIGTCLFDLVDPAEASDLETLFGNLIGSGQSAELTVNLVVDGVTRVFELEATDRTDNVNLQGLIVVLHEVTDRHMLEGELRHQASHDALTGLPNRVLLTERAQSAVDTGALTSLLFVDLDDFKHVNDGLGHHAGDALLIAVAGRLQHAARELDTVARLGGDEFAILVVGDTDAAEAVARRVLDVLTRPFDVLGHRLSVGASVGVATVEGGSVEELLRHADVAMYSAKAAGKGTLARFDTEMQDKSAERLSLHTELAEAITSGQLRLCYQPIIDLASGDLRSGEALVRWQHPRLGLLSPDRFIPLAEDTGLIVALGRWVLEEACRQATSWPEDVSVAVNLSARQLEDDSLLDDVTRVLTETGLTPSRLVLEVTETVVMLDIDTTVTRLAELRERGIRIAVDDFGTGYSSLSSLMRLPVDVLKIDRSFIASMLDRPEASSLARVLVDMGRTLGLEVVAEGIEEATQEATLRAFACEQGQGFLYSRPVDAAQFLEVVAQRARVPLAALGSPSS